MVCPLLFAASVAFACNGPPPPSVSNAFREADFVVIAKTISIHQQRISENGVPYVVEKDTFKVLQAFKGPYAPGEFLSYITTIGMGSCGVSAQGLKAMDRRGKVRFYDFSGTWLLYGVGSEPYELDLMGRTAPMEYGGKAQIRELRRLATPRGGEPSSCEKDMQPVKMGAAASPVGEAARHPPGRVLLTFLVKADGSVSNVRVMHSSDDWYNSSAVDLVRGFKFSPRSSPCQGQYQVRFTLQ